MASHHPDLESGTAKSLNNMVLCMISEYHLTCLSQGPSYISPVLPEAAKNLLPSMEEYLAGGDFQGTRDLRVLERAKTLWVAVWLHRLDMATDGDRMVSYSLDAARHGRGPLLGFFFTLQASNLMFEEVVHWSWQRTGTSWRAHWTMFRSSGLGSTWSSRTSLRLMKESLRNPLKRR